MCVSRQIFIWKIIWYPEPELCLIQIDKINSKFKFISIFTYMKK